MKDRSMSTILGAIALAGMFVAPYFALIFASVEKEQKLAQKIFYFHVPCAWVSFMGFFIVFVASILYLWKKDRIFDIWASAAAEVGVLFCSLVLLTGPIWAKPIWNTWWVWDAKLTTTLVLWLIYVAYLMLRSFGGDQAQNAKFRAVLGIVGFLDVPLIYYSVNIWRTLHPKQLVLRGGVTGGYVSSVYGMPGDLYIHVRCDPCPSSFPSQSRGGTRRDQIQAPGRGGNITIKENEKCKMESAKCKMEAFTWIIWVIFVRRIRSSGSCFSATL